MQPWYQERRWLLSLADAGTDLYLSHQNTKNDVGKLYKCVYSQQNKSFVPREGRSQNQAAHSWSDETR